MITSSQAGGSGSQEDARDDELSILVNGERWTGWQELEVVRSLDAGSGRFTVKIPPVLGTTWPLRPGNEVEVSLGEDAPILTGYVDDVSAEFGPEGRTVKATGRDKAGDLIDCSVDLETYEWREQTLKQIVEDLIGPYGVSLAEVSHIASERFPLFSCSSTDKVWGIIQRACRQKALLPFSRPDGKLAILRPLGHSPAVDLIEGENVIRARLRWDVSNRFQTYRVEGQRSGDDEGWGEQVISLSGTATDPQILRNRIRTIRGEQGMTPEDCQNRAEWDATISVARSTFVEVEVAGWRIGIDNEATYPPWEIRMTPYLDLPSLGIRGTMLVSRVRFKRGLKGGPRTSIELVPPTSFDPKPSVEPVTSLDGFLISDDATDDR